MSDKAKFAALQQHMRESTPESDEAPVASFIDVLHDFLVSKGTNYKEMIDTPEERAALEKVIGDEFDHFVAPKIPAKIRAFTKRGILAATDAMLVTLGN